MKHDQFEPGMIVYYVPAHAHGDLNHRDVEQGEVTSKNESYVFVRFEDRTSKGCLASQLVAAD